MRRRRRPRRRQEVQPGTSVLAQPPTLPPKGARGTQTVSPARSATAAIIIVGGKQRAPGDEVATQPLNPCRRKTRRKPRRLQASTPRRTSCSIRNRCHRGAQRPRCEKTTQPAPGQDRGIIIVGGKQVQPGDEVQLNPQPLPPKGAAQVSAVSSASANANNSNGDRHAYACPTRGVGSSSARFGYCHGRDGAASRPQTSIPPRTSCSTHSRCRPRAPCCRSASSRC